MEYSCLRICWSCSGGIILIPLHAKRRAHCALHTGESGYSHETYWFSYLFEHKMTSETHVARVGKGIVHCVEFPRGVTSEGRFRGALDIWRRRQPAVGGTAAV